MWKLKKQVANSSPVSVRQRSKTRDKRASVLHVVCADSASPASHSKPSSVAFCEVVCKTGELPASPTECTECYNIACSHESIVFTPEQRGKTLYGFARWVNRNGKYGPWSGLFSAIIP